MGAGLKARNLLRKKYPLIISDERVSLSHLNLMTLGLVPEFFSIPAICIKSRIMQHGKPAVYLQKTFAA